MSLLTSSLPSSSSPSCLSQNHQIPNVRFRSMSFLRRHHRRTLNTAISACVRQDTAVWTPAPLKTLTKAAEDLYNITINVSDSPHLISFYTKPGQYIQVKLPEIEKPSFLAIAYSSPKSSSSNGEFQFLVKSIEGSIAQLLCGLKKGDVVELSSVMGKGFD
ncbi:hypothetical protein MKW94_016728, partial [Papaver nudicaule]|nr:hypothetical protein [Papaver nudicaule]